MSELKVTFDGKEHSLNFNTKTGYYEIDLKAPTIPNIYNINAKYTNLFKTESVLNKEIQILEKEKIEIVSKRIFMWVFDGDNFSVKAVLEVSDNYEINIDNETNANTLVYAMSKNSAKQDDIVLIKKGNKKLFWGKIDDVQNENGKKTFLYTLKYITNIFDQEVILKNESLIKENGLEDFIAKTITDNFITNTDTFLNKTFLEVVIKTHTKKQTSVTNVQDGIYNLNTWMTNCTQLYNISYDFTISNKKLIITIENKKQSKKLIDTTFQNITEYKEVFETNIISKVVVLTKSEGTYELFLLTDRTTTTNSKNENRAKGKVKIVYTEKMEDAQQKALDTLKSNSYNHNITFKSNEIIELGTPIAIKTKNSTILDTYISAIQITKNNFRQYTCGNIRTTLIDKLLKERRNK